MWTVHAYDNQPDQTYAVLKDKADHLTCLKFYSLHESLAQSL